jgi:phosphoglycerate-specific signal transduction histidine kinase
MTNRSHYYLQINDLAHARGAQAELSYEGAGPNDFAAALQEALRSPLLFQRWRALQPDPDEIDERLGVTDQLAKVSAKLVDLHTDVEVISDLPMSILRQRLNWLIGAHWQLHDVRPA